VPEREMQQALATGRGEDDRWQIRKDGSRFWCSGVMTPLKENGGKLRGFAKIMRDLTERKTAEDRLRATKAALTEANRQKDRFLAVLSHELRNPLAPIRNIVQLLCQQTTENPTLQQACGIMDRQLQVLTRLVDDLLDLSRIASGKVQINKELVELSVVMQRAADMARPAIDVRRHKLTISHLKESLWFQADPVRLEQAMLNLLNNAAKYTDEGGQIWLAAEREGESILIRVRDTGIGIERDAIPHIFEMFTQADPSSQHSLGGLGIGLSVVRKIVEMHGGTVDVLSAGRGKGSEFIIRLPVLPVETGKQIPAKGATKPTAPPLRVLVVDDNTDSADSLAMLLKLYGHEVQAVYSGTAALNVVKNYHPKVILLDLSMPVMDGYQTAHRLRLNMDMSSVVLIAMTGYGHEAERQRTKDEGFAYHVVKPVDPQQLQDLLANLTNED